MLLLLVVVAAAEEDVAVRGLTKRSEDVGAVGNKGVVVDIAVLVQDVDAIRRSRREHETQIEARSVRHPVYPSFDGELAHWSLTVD